MLQCLLLYESNQLYIGLHRAALLKYLFLELYERLVQDPGSSSSEPANYTAARELSPSLSAALYAAMVVLRGRFH